MAIADDNQAKCQSKFEFSRSYRRAAVWVEPGNPANVSSRGLVTESRGDGDIWLKAQSNFRSNMCEVEDPSLGEMDIAPDESLGFRSKS